ncbi:MAG TPA: family 10 glycosylhydrolase [Actinomycetaceae bacterium]|nr:family 10 glycosylhydrolase [Actinomycetaceae bacterium]
MRVRFANRFLPLLLAAMLAVALLPVHASAGASAAAFASPGTPGPASAVSAPLAASTTGQFRGYWVDAFNPGIYTPAQIDSLIADAQRVRANALIVQTSRRFDCFCNDSLYPRTAAAISALPFDPLETLVQRAHAAGMEVHAWVNATTLWNSATAPAAADHAYNTHGPSASGADRWLNKRVDGVEIVSNNSYVDPANPAAVDYIVEAVTSITSAYDVDGVTLDYIRYPDYNSGSANDWGYSSTSLSRFRAESGRTGTPAASDPEFSEWRRDQVTALVRKVYLAMYEVDPSDRLSVSGITYGYGPQSTGGWESTSAYRTVLQDWRGWLEEGIVDTVATMNYKRQHLADQAQMFSEWTEATVQYQGDRQNIVGPALYLNDLDGSIAQAKAVKAAGVGWAGYSYANASQAAAASTSSSVKNSERGLLQDRLRSEVFTGTTTVPAMSWKTAPTTGHLAGTVRDGAALDQVEVTVRLAGGSSTDVRSSRTDGNGWFGIVDLRPGTWVVSVTEPGLTGCEVTVTVAAGELADVELTLGPCTGPSTRFTDVPAGSQFFSEIEWLASEAITTGYPDGTFRPLDPVNRDAMAAFLYRLAGEPAFTPPATSPFTDVAPEIQFYPEITWLASTGISTGWDTGGGTAEFRPWEPINRDAMAAFLYRFAGEPGFTPPETSPFRDVTPEIQFYPEITWLASTGISTGWDTGGGAAEYRPWQPIARDAMAAFLYRYVEEFGW